MIKKEYTKYFFDLLLLQAIIVSIMGIATRAYFIVENLFNKSFAYRYFYEFFQSLLFLLVLCIFFIVYNNLKINLNKNNKLLKYMSKLFFIIGILNLLNINLYLDGDAFMNFIFIKFDIFSITYFIIATLLKININQNY